MDVPPDWLLWQIADSAFPTGGFAHSGGTEAACQVNALRGRGELIEFLEAAIAQCSSASLPFVAAAWEGIPGYKPVNEACEAFTSNHVANRASRLQGQAFFNSAERIFFQTRLTDLREAVLPASMHFAPVFGVIARRLGLAKCTALRLYVFLQLRGWLSSAVRLNIVGPLEAQALQARFAARAESAVDRCVPLEEVAQTAPIIDLFQGCQDRLYSRLFQS